LKIFINGLPAGTAVASDNLTRDFQIGNALNFMGRGRDIGLKGGMVDEVAIYLRAISNVEVIALFSGKNMSLSTKSATRR